MSESQPGMYMGENRPVREEKSWSRILMGLSEKYLELNVFPQTQAESLYLLLSLTKAG
jgi:hypothetical protein